MTTPKLMTAGKAAKQRGTTLKRVSETLDISPQTLHNWFTDKPKLFHAVISYVADLNPSTD